MPHLLHVPNSSSPSTSLLHFRHVENNLMENIQTTSASLICVNFRLDLIFCNLIEVINLHNFCTILNCRQLHLPTKLLHYQLFNFVSFVGYQFIDVIFPECYPCTFSFVSYDDILNVFFIYFCSILLIVYSEQQFHWHVYPQIYKPQVPGVYKSMVYQAKIYSHDLFILFIYYEFCQKTGLYRRTSLQSYSPHTYIQHIKRNNLHGQDRTTQKQ